MKIHQLKQYVVILFMLWSVEGVSQHFNCGTPAAQQEIYNTYPDLIHQQELYDNFIRDYVLQHYGQTGRTQLIIPVVFHIIHDYGVENLPDENIHDQMEILNRDFNRLNLDTANVIPEFKSIVADIGIEFRLAQIDPQGNCTNGIDRIASPLTYLGNDAAKLNPWDRRKYLNIWTVRRMANGVAGYAYKPMSVSGVNFPVDGIILLHDYIGSLAPSNETRSRALTHEIGHWLNLSHPWGDNNNPGQGCGDDGIADTPLTRGWTTCPVPANSAICTPGIKENYQNFMDYSYCSVMFTEGQKQAMLAALSSDVSHRNNLWTNETLIQTGVLNPQSCIAQADFYTNSRYICNGSSVSFMDNSLRGTPTSWSWSFPGGSPSSSTAQNPVVSYANPGSYSVSLTVSNAQGTSTHTLQNYIYVSPDWSDLLGNYNETFENPQNTERWMMLNPSQNTKKWQVANNVGYSGSSCLMLSGFYQGEGDVDELISPSYDLRYMSSINVSFKFIGASMSTNLSGMRDSLNVFVSTDCGRNWGAPRLTIKRATLIKGGQTNSFFVPDAGDTWNHGTFTLPSSLAQENVRFRFRYTSGRMTNNFFLDDFNVSGVLSVDESNLSENSVGVFPNPINDLANIKLMLKEPAMVAVDLLDITGRQLVPVFEGMQTVSTQVYPLRRQNLSAGVYLLRVTIGEETSFHKLVME
jgi:PKD repeat protein